MAVSTWPGAMVTQLQGGGVQHRFCGAPVSGGRICVEQDDVRGCPSPLHPAPGNSRGGRGEADDPGLHLQCMESPPRNAAAQAIAGRARACWRRRIAMRSGTSHQHQQCSGSPGRPKASKADCRNWERALKRLFQRVPIAFLGIDRQ